MYIGKCKGVEEFQILSPINGLLFRLKSTDYPNFMDVLESSKITVDIVNSNTGAVQNICANAHLMAYVCMQDGITLGCQPSWDNVDGELSETAMVYSVFVRLAEGALNLGYDKYIRLRVESVVDVTIDGLEDGELTNDFIRFEYKYTPSGVLEYPIDVRRGRKFGLLAYDGYIDCVTNTRRYRMDIAVETVNRVLRQEPNMAKERGNMQLEYSRYMDWLFSIDVTNVNQLTVYAKDANTPLQQFYFLTYTETIKL